MLTWLDAQRTRTSRPARSAPIPEHDSPLQLAVARSILSAAVTPGPLPLTSDDIPLLP